MLQALPAPVELAARNTTGAPDDNTKATIAWLTPAELAPADTTGAYVIRKLRAAPVELHPWAITDAPCFNCVCRNR